VLNTLDETILATDEIRLAVKLVMAWEAMQSCPAGGSLAKVAEGVTRTIQHIHTPFLLLAQSIEIY
jgi:hypothetical protein